MKNFTLVLFPFFLSFLAHSQAGISVSPARIYYKNAAGTSEEQTIKINNPTDTELQIGVSFNDWEYESNGNNKILAVASLKTSNTEWIQILQGSYFVLKAGETKEITVKMNVPELVDTAIPVHTTMLFFTQLNPSASTDTNGAAIQVAVRIGIKVYHSFGQKTESNLELVDFTSYADENKNKIIELKMVNKGAIWTDGKIEWELFHTGTGLKTKLKPTDFYTLPNDTRILKQVLDPKLAKGNYTISATLNYGESDVIKVAELEFSL